MGRGFRRAKVEQNLGGLSLRADVKITQTCNSTSQLFKITLSYLAASCAASRAKKGVVRLCLTVTSVPRVVAFSL
jgi:hypothetical protein